MRVPAFRAEEELPAPFVETGGHLANISGLYRVLEADLVNAGVEGYVAGDLILYEDSAALCHDLTKDDSGDHRIAGEMASGEKLVLFDGVF